VKDRFVHICGIDNHHCLNYIFIIYNIPIKRPDSLSLVIAVPRELEYAVLLDTELPFNFVADVETVVVDLMLREVLLISTIIN